MDSACFDQFGAPARAATTDEFMSGLISGLPEANGDKYVLLKCPNCEGVEVADAASGHARLCVAPDAAWPTSIDDFHDGCEQGIRHALCVQ